MTKKTWVWAVVCGLLACAAASAQCVSLLQPVSLPVVFPNHEAGPVAWTGSLLGVAKLDSDQFSNAIWFGVYDGNLLQVVNDKLVVPVSAGGPLALLWNGSDFGLFYETQSNQQLTLQRIDLNGNTIGAPVAIAPGHALGTTQDFDFAWDATGKAYWIARTTRSGFDRGLWLTTVSASGVHYGDDLITFNISDSPHPRLAVADGVRGTLIGLQSLGGVTWSRVVDGQEEQAFAVVTPGQPVTAVATVAKGATNGVIATDGRFFLLAYESPASGGTTEIRTTKFDTTGRLVSADSRLVSPSGIDVVPASLVANNTLGEWALLYIDAQFGVLSTFPPDTRLRRIPFDSSAPQSDTLFVFDQTKRSLQPTGNMLWTGSAYVGAIGRYISRVEGSESYLVRHCPLIASIIATPSINNPNQPITFVATTSGGNGPYTYAWTFGDVSAPAQGPTVSHSYRDVGAYVATVTVRDQTGGVTIARTTVQIAILKHRAAKK